jgi:GTP-binding protein YchF
MHVSAGLVGLPNVGKSTLFNALTKSSVPAENYPFCTIDPHTAITFIPDDRLEILKSAYRSAKIVPATMKFVDIAGLVKGAASGEGLGNQFLAHIREVDLIIHVVRCFEDPDIIRNDLVDPLSDIDIITTELILRDIESVTKRQAKRESLLKQARSNPQELAALEREGKALITILAALNSSDLATVQQFHHSPDVPRDLLLSSKNYLIVANMGESEVTPQAYQQNDHYRALITRFGKDRVIPLSARLEHELSLLSENDAQEMMNAFGMSESGLNQLIAAAYRQLNQITFFTCGPQEIHAWPIQKGITIRQAAGEIHTDLQKGFICAEIISYHDRGEGRTEAQLRAEGKIRTEGQDYLVQDGDIVHVRFNV